MGDINKLCDRMSYWCQSANLGYDQSNRQDFRDGGECDCSSLVIHCLQEAGFDTGSASYTGNMSSELCARGWSRVAVDGSPQKGDILLNDKNHVALWLGDCLGEASGDERGGITGGAGGDQTGRETHLGAYYNYPWSCYLRYTGGGSSQPGTNAEFRYRSYSNGRWLGECVNLSNSAGDGFSGLGDSPITGISVGVNQGSVKYRAYTNETGWLPWVEQYDPNNYEWGMAGDLEHAITAIQVYWYSPSGQNCAKYAVLVNGEWYADQIDTQTSNGQDGYAGDKQNAICGFRLNAI